MRNLIKKILKEENDWFDDVVDSNIYIPKVGDLFYIPQHGYRVKIKSIKCEENFEPNERKEMSTGWGIVTFMDYGCQVFIESDAHGKWESGDREGIRLGWIHVLLDKKYWVQQGNMNEQEEEEWFEDIGEVQGSKLLEQLRKTLKPHGMKILRNRLNGYITIYVKLTSNRERESTEGSNQPMVEIHENNFTIDNLKTEIKKKIESNIKQRDFSINLRKQAGQKVPLWITNNAQYRDENLKKLYKIIFNSNPE